MRMADNIIEQNQDKAQNYYHINFLILRTLEQFDASRLEKHQSETLDQNVKRIIKRNLNPKQLALARKAKSLVADTYTSLREHLVDFPVKILTGKMTSEERKYYLSR